MLGKHTHINLDDYDIVEEDFYLIGSYPCYEDRYNPREKHGMLLINSILKENKLSIRPKL